MAATGPDYSDEAASDGAPTRWLSIEAACEILGVDRSTLRRWSDSGRIPVYRTPGGHRRYREEDLRDMLTSERRPRRVSRQALTDLSISAYGGDYVQTARSRPWYRAYNPEQLDELRQIGRRLVELAIHAISGRAERALDDGKMIGRRYGAVSAEAGLSVTDAVEAFLFFRYPVVQAVIRYIEAESIPAKRAGRIFAEISQFMDQILIATVSAHAEASGEAPPRSG